MQTEQCGWGSRICTRWAYCINTCIHGLLVDVQMMCLNHADGVEVCTLFVLIVQSAHSVGSARPPLPPLPPLSPSVAAQRHMALPPLSTIDLCAQALACSVCAIHCLLLHIFPAQLAHGVYAPLVFTLVRVYLPYLLHVHYNQKLKFCTSICSKDSTHQ